MDLQWCQFGVIFGYVLPQFGTNFFYVVPLWYPFTTYFSFGVIEYQYIPIYFDTFPILFLSGDIEYQYITIY